MWSNLSLKNIIWNGGSIYDELCFVDEKRECVQTGFLYELVLVSPADSFVILIQLQFRPATVRATQLEPVRSPNTCIYIFNRMPITSVPIGLARASAANNFRSRRHGIQHLLLLLLRRGRGQAHEAQATAGARGSNDDHPNRSRSQAGATPAAGTT